MLSLLANKYVVSALIALAALAAVWGYGRYQYSEGVHDTEIAAQLAAADQYKEDIGRMNDSIAFLQTHIQELENAKPKVITRYRDRVVEAPLDATCRIDDERLSRLRAGLEAARTSGKPSSPLPKTP